MEVRLANFKVRKFAQVLGQALLVQLLNQRLMVNVAVGLLPEHDGQCVTVALLELAYYALLRVVAGELLQFSARSKVTLERVARRLVQSEFDSTNHLVTDQPMQQSVHLMVHQVVRKLVTDQEGELGLVHVGQPQRCNRHKERLVKAHEQARRVFIVEHADRRHRYQLLQIVGLDELGETLLH